MFQGIDFFLIGLDVYWILRSPIGVGDDIFVGDDIGVWNDIVDGDDIRGVDDVVRLGMIIT